MILHHGVENCSVGGNGIIPQNIKQCTNKYVFLFDMVSESVGRTYGGKSGGPKNGILFP